MSALLLLKLCLVPALIYAVTLAGRRWGAGVAGWLSALPVVAGPILLTIALERGAGFAAISAANTLLAVIGCVAFCLAYAWVSARAGVALSLAVALAAFAVAGALLQSVPIPPRLGFPFVLAVLVLAPTAFPRVPAPAVGQGRTMADLPFRMAAGALLTLSVTLAAGTLGARLSGLLAMFPVMGTILTGFTHRAAGRAAAVALLRGMLLGYFGFASFCVVLAYALRAWPIGPAFALALACALVVQVSVKRFGQGVLVPAKAGA